MNSRNFRSSINREVAYLKKALVSYRGPGRRYSWQQNECCRVVSFCVATDDELNTGKKGLMSPTCALRVGRECWQRQLSLL